MPDLLGRTRDEMDRWVREHIGNRNWYETIQRKDRELKELTAFLRERQRAFLALVQEQQRALEPKKQLLEERQQKAQEQATAITKALSELSGKMQKVLPEWLRDLVSPEEMLQVYPVVLLFLVGFVGFKAGLVRHHYRVLCESLKGQGLSSPDWAMSSPT